MSVGGQYSVFTDAAIIDALRTPWVDFNGALAEARVDAQRLLLSVRSNGDDQPSGVYALKLNAGQLNDRAPAPVLVAQVDGPGKLLWRPAPAAAPAR